jgi:hypothetical protein
MNYVKTMDLFVFRKLEIMSKLWICLNSFYFVENILMHVKIGKNIYMKK